MPEIVSGKPINEQGSRPLHNRSKFNNSYRLAGTYRFGEYQPHFAADVIPNDNHTLNSGHVIRSYTLGQPMMQGLDIKKDYFFVPKSALLPVNYEKFITTPNIGEDINAELVGTSVKGFTNYVYNFLDSFHSYIGTLDYSADPEGWLAACFKYVIAADMLLSDGSLLSSLGCHIGRQYVDNVLPLTADAATDKWWSMVAAILAPSTPAAILNITFGSGSDAVDAQIEYKSVNQGDISCTLREAISRMRDDFDFVVNTVDFSSADHSAADLAAELPDYSYYLVPDADAAIDLGRCMSYQISCAHFFTNDKVDYVYSAELYRQNIHAILRTALPLGSFYYDAYYTWNGTPYHYDTLSAFYFVRWISTLFNSSANFTTYYSLYHVPFLNYLRWIFGFNRSLRFIDYFTGSRAWPLAELADTNVAVNNGYVSVVDMIQKRWYTKMWSQVNRVGRTLKEQMKGLFPGVHDVQDYHEPIWLGHTQDSIHGEEVDNTGAEQFSSNPIPVTSSFNSNAERYGFDISVPNYYGYVIGITYFDIARFYSRNIERTFFNVDRYDMFNPFLQFNGDQPVYKKELYGSSPISTTFGYQGSYMEMKQRVNEAFGGFINKSLPGMLFLADEGRDYFSINNISPDYIRSYPQELDKFYKGLSGWSLGTYFHFIIINTNKLISSRPMAANPQID